LKCKGKEKGAYEGCQNSRYITFLGFLAAPNHLQSLVKQQISSKSLIHR